MNLLPIVTSPLDMLFDFLPFELRRVQSRGVQVFDLYYWHDDLTDLIGHKDPREVRYDPRDVSRVYVRGTDGEVKVCQCTKPGFKEISLHELRANRRRQKAAADDPAQRALRDAGMEANDALVEQSVSATRAARRKAAREKERQRGAKETAELNGVTTKTGAGTPTGSGLDPSAPIPDFVTDHIDYITPNLGTGELHAKH